MDPSQYNSLRPSSRGKKYSDRSEQIIAHSQQSKSNIKHSNRPKHASEVDNANDADEVESLESDVLNFTEGVSSKTGSAAALSNQRSMSMSRGAVTHKNSNRSQRKGARGYEND